VSRRGHREGYTTDAERDQLRRLQPLLKSIYNRNSAGCCLHVVIDDGNWDCGIDEDDCLHEDCRQAAEILIEMGLETRERIAHSAGLELRYVGEDGSILYEAEDKTPWAMGAEL